MAIVLGAFLGTAFYFWCRKMLAAPENRIYVREHVFLHPNSICYIRTVLAWIGYGAYFFFDWQSSGIIIFTFAAILDGVDGLVARKCDLITHRGESLDPLCDKLTYLPPLISFAYTDIITPLYIWIFVAIELSGQFFARTVLERFALSVSANNFGKIKTIISFALVILCALANVHPQWIMMCDEILILCIVLGCASIIFKFVNRNVYADVFSFFNLISGISGIIIAVLGHTTLAVLAVIAGQLFDLLDGYAAKKIATTRFSPYIDYLADLFSFGLCPMVIMSIQYENLGILPAFVYFLCVMYHVSTHNNDRRTGVFTGLPPAAGALIVLGGCLSLNSVSAIGLTMVTSASLISNVRFAHLGTVIRSHIPRPIFFVLSALILMMIAYILKSQDSQLLGYTILLCAMVYLMAGIYLSRLPGSHHDHAS